MLTDRDIASMRATLNGSLPNTCIIMRSTAGTSDGAGGYIGGTVSAAGTVACRVSPYPAIMSTEQNVAGQVGAIEFWQITMPAETDILATDRVQSGDAMFEIIGAPGDRSWELSRRMLAKKVE